MTYQQNDYNSHTKTPLAKKLLAWFGVLFFLFVIVGTYRLIQSYASSEFVIDRGDPSKKRNPAATVVPFKDEKPESASEYVMPLKEKDRLDILVLGMRGKDDPENGGLLTDTILLFSLNQKTGQAGIVSIPRDFYVQIGEETSDKINSVFERLGITETKKLFSRITGVYVDHIAVFDFTAFKEIVDALGGIDVTLEKPFEEATQWGYAFSLPAGLNHLDGEAALYYVRSRYSSNDFDRAARQQKVILAIKEKAVSTSLMTDPGKALALVSAVRKNVQTDINLLDVSTWLNLAEQATSADADIKREVVSTENYLYESRSAEGAYILLPKDNTLEPLKTFFRGLVTK